MKPEYFTKFHKFFADKYLTVPTYGVFQDGVKFYVAEMVNGYAKVWEIDWEITTPIDAESMPYIWRDFNEDGELVGLVGEGFRGKFVKVLAKIGVCV